MINQRQGASIVASTNRPRQGNSRFSSERHLGLKQQRVAFSETDKASRVDNRPHQFAFKHGKRPPRWEYEEYRDYDQIHCWVDLVLPLRSRKQPTKKQLEAMGQPDKLPKRLKINNKPMNLHPVPQTRRAAKKYRPMHDNARAFLDLNGR